MLSGIQHIAFCERQYALIYIEQQWIENKLTAEGRILHERVDNPLENESRRNRQFLRSVPLVSYELGLYGRADLVELHLIEGEHDANAVKIEGKPGSWKIIPVEYKRGKPKSDDCDRVQLCAQAICLEEMYHTFIPEAYLYYGQPHHRYPVALDVDLRRLTKAFSLRMHELFNIAHTPLPEYKKHCHSCSMYDICQPRMLSKAKIVSDYLNEMLIEE